MNEKKKIDGWLMECVIIDPFNREKQMQAAFSRGENVRASVFLCVYLLLCDKEW